ncbi:hypothetical protein Calow_1402 [Caldicellulosiruptor owensensis OL]|uniref:Uncharacterized protein n=1 Tax=Caldicellulosiruptor owensensis (strain ATCC 700167 / DSM 13100 / OL) TaxID=632518 RepID=E4Q2T4_CALOW|nr:hypothetical protein Calow_1402 [Caldicellulosiruptor owensensis OL]
MYLKYLITLVLSVLQKATIFSIKSKEVFMVLEKKGILFVLCKEMINKYFIDIIEEIKVLIQMLTNNKFKVCLYGKDKIGENIAEGICRYFNSSEVTVISEENFLSREFVVAICFDEDLVDKLIAYNITVFLLDIDNSQINKYTNRDNVKILDFSNFSSIKIIEDINKLLAKPMSKYNFGKHVDSKEFESLKNKIMAKIEQSILEGRLYEAKQIVSELEGILPTSEIHNLKGIIAFYEKKYDVAEREFKKGLLYDNSNSDIYYNLGCVYEEKGIISEAAVYFALAEKFSESIENSGEKKNIFYQYPIFNRLREDIKKIKPKNYIILSSCRWGSMLQRPHHIAKALAQIGNNVYFISPPISVEFEEELIYGNIMKNILSQGICVEGVKIYQPICVYKGGKVVYSTYVDLVQFLLSYILKEHEGEIVIVAYLPFHINVVKNLKGNFKLVYECVDDHTDLENSFWVSEKDIEYEQELLNFADYITTSSTALYLQRISIEGRKNTILVKNAVNEVDFRIENNYEPDELKNIPHPRIVYCGAIYERFDTDLFYKIVESNPDKSFIVIGPDLENKLTRVLPNLYLLGVIQHERLKYYLNAMDVGIIPFKEDAQMVISCDSIKYYEYVASGLPVIGTFIPELLIGKIYSFCASTVEEFNTYINKALKLKIDKKIIREFLWKNSWVERALTIHKVVEDGISKEDLAVTVEAIKEELENLIYRYRHPNLLVLYGMLNRNSNRELYLKYLKEAFERSNSHFIKKQYLVALEDNQANEREVKQVLLSMYKDREVAFLINTPFQYYLYINVINELIKKGIKPTVIIYDIIKNNSEWKKMFEINVDFIYKKLADKVRIDYFTLFLHDRKKYRCLITNTYFGDNIWSKADYHIRMFYGFAKEVYACGWWNIYYDTILCAGKYDYSKLNIYNTCEVIGYPKFDDWFKRRNILEKEAKKDFDLDLSKKVILYVPTYGALSSIEEWGKTLTQLKNKYNIIVKLHHHTAYLDSEKRRREFIFNNFNYVVDDRYDLLKVLSITDYMLFDNSGVFFDGILADVNMIKLEFDFKEESVSWLTNRNSIEQKIKN